MNGKPGASCRGKSGFTLIELMIVVAIIGILAAIAIPAYQRYAIRAQVAEGLNLISSMKTTITAFYTERGTPPADRLAAGLPQDPTSATGNYVSQIDIQNGAIIVTYGNAANATITGLTLGFVPYEAGDRTVVWICGSATAPAGAALLGTAAGSPADKPNSSVPSEYTPAACR